MRARLALAAVLALTTAVAFVVANRSEDAAAVSDRVTIRMHYTRFEPSEVTVKAGTEVTFEIVNTDPIEHEWMIGDAEMHERHRTGTEMVHDSIPTEVSVPALQTRVTRLTFDEPGDYQYICHLPGHEKYGMVGVLHVVP